MRWSSLTDLHPAPDLSGFRLSQFCWLLTLAASSGLLISRRFLWLAKTPHRQSLTRSGPLGTLALPAREAVHALSQVWA